MHTLELLTIYIKMPVSCWPYAPSGCASGQSPSQLGHPQQDTYQLGLRGSHAGAYGRQLTRRADIYGEQFERVRRVGAQGASVGDCDSTVEMHSVCCEDCSTQSATDAQTAQSLRFGHNIHRHTQ